MISDNLVRKAERTRKQIAIDEALLSELVRAKAHYPEGLLEIIPRDGITVSASFEVLGVEECVASFKRECAHFFR